jgi:hypothetical protein
MAYTIRTTEEDEKNLKKLMEILDVNSVSKALLIAAVEVPRLSKLLIKSQSDVVNRDAKLRVIKEARDQIKEAKRQIDKIKL